MTHQMNRRKIHHRPALFMAFFLILQGRQMQNCRLTYLFTYLLTKIPRCRYNAMFFERPCETVIIMDKCSISSVYCTSVSKHQGASS